MKNLSPLSLARGMMTAALLTMMLTSPASGADTPGYQIPPPELKAIVDAPRSPYFALNASGNHAVVAQRPGLPGIDLVAQPELKLAGLRLNPDTGAAIDFDTFERISLLEIASQTSRDVSGLPSPARYDDIAWAPDGRHFIVSHNTGSAIQLWIVDVATAKARRLLEEPINQAHGRGFAWLGGSQRLLVKLRPAGRKAPAAPTVPAGPNIQETQPGAIKQSRTFPDLLKSPHDANLLDHYLTSQLAVVSLDGKVQTIGKPDLITSAAPAPDGEHILVHIQHRPYSYLVPMSAFPRRVEVWNRAGKVVHKIADLPLVEGLPPGNDSVRTGPRHYSWRADVPATLTWVEAQDEGDPAKAAEIRDIVYQQAAPFREPPRPIARLATRFSGIEWARGDLALVTEYWWKSRQVKVWRIAPDKLEQAPKLIHAFASEDHYADPGAPITRPTASGHEVLRLDGDAMLLAGVGGSPEGDRPFLDRYDFATGETRRLWRCEAKAYERIKAVLDDQGRRLVTSRESPTERPNYYLRQRGDTPGAEPPLVPLTRLPHPTPQLKDVQKELIRYRRADGVELTATLYLPAGYDPKRDGPLPTLMWAYPHEFKSAKAASQVTKSPYLFNWISPSGPLPFLARGYAVLDHPTMPIVGEGSVEPNDTYLEQLTASAQAAVDEVVRRGVADRHRIAIGGHSYGAFMTANLLAHSKLFRAGIARSGAYNRTLTPFGFQAEDRPYWQAKETYDKMSPFSYADRIKAPILLIHGEMDSNSGTFPIQSERLFQALKGLGATARLVMLPNESHSYRARESNLHMLWEIDQWLEKYVKSAKPEESSR